MATTTKKTKKANNLYAGFKLPENGITAHFPVRHLSEPLVKWYRKHCIPYPWRINWSRHQNPYHVWLSEIMLQQTLIKVVVPIYQRFLDTFPDVFSLAQATENNIRQEVRGLGYYRRFALLHKASQHLVQNHTINIAGCKKIDWPTNYQALKMLPGIGDYTAAAISSICFSEPTPVVDGNVERVLCRLFDLRVPSNLPKLKKIFFNFLSEAICSKSPGDFNQGIMELGQHICTPQNPSCHQCPLAKLCLAYKKHSQDYAPAPKLRKAVENIEMRLHIIRHKNKIAILPRSPNAKFLKNTAGFLTSIKKSTKEIFDGYPKLKVAESPLHIGKIKHNITNHKIKADVCLITVNSFNQIPNIDWTSPAQVERKLISNLDRKAWKLLINSSKWQ
ncbi:MAG: hypothetical protein R3B45_02170 [Bdellovibrionota bacterium]